MEPLIKKGHPSYNVLFGIIVAAGALAYISLTCGKYVWLDEAYTLVTIRHSYPEIAAITAMDVHPPLYFMLLKFFTWPFGYTPAAAKIFSTVPYILILIIAGIQLKKLFNEKTAITFMLLFILFPFLLNYAIEIRMYSLAALFVFVNGIYAYRYYTENLNGGGYLIWILSGVCASYTHYFALVSVGVIYGLLFIAILKNKKYLLKRWFMAVILTFVLYLPWLGFFVKQLIYKVNNDYWIPPLTRQTIKEYIVTMFCAEGINHFELFALCSYLTVFLFTVFSRNKRLIVLSACALLVPACTIFVGVCASLLVRPVFVIRYAIPSVPFLIFFMAIGIAHIKFKPVVFAIGLIALTGGISNYWETLQVERSVIENALDGSFLEENSDCDAYVVMTTLPQVACVIAYYEPEKLVYSEPVGTVAGPYENLAYIGDLDMDAYEKIMLVIDAGGTVPDDLENLYDCRYIEEVYESGTTADVYMLTR